MVQGKKLGIQGDIVVADRVENLSSGIVFAPTNFIENMNFFADFEKSVQASVSM